MAKKSKDDEALSDLLAIHYARGALKEQDVPVGRHELTGKRIVIDLPDGAVLERLPGSLEDDPGFEPVAPKVDLLAALLFLKKGCTLNGSKAKKLWQQCLAESATSEDKAEKHLPLEAVQALAEIAEKLTGKKKTSATRVGIALAKVTVESK